MSSGTASTFMIDELGRAGVGPTPAAAGNQEAVAAWDGVLFDRYAAFRHLILPGLGAHGDRALALYPPREGERVLDIGCGFGDATQQIAQLVGPRGEVVGVDASARFVTAATAEARNLGIANARFAVADVEAGVLEDGFDAAFSRMGTMFFANPVAALRNVRQALVPGGRLCMVVWRQKPDNPWLHQAELAVEKLVERRVDSDEPTCGPGPFSMADADTTSAILVSAGYEDISLTRSDIPMLIGRDLQEATDCTMALGPAGEIIRLAGEDAEQIKPKIVDAVRRVLAQFDGPHGVRAQMSTWIVSARTPQ
jgi:ubiquinone/menaquinone biosynthesis C-methylase UbiE